MYRSLYFKIILILIVFITTVMVVVGTILLTGVSGYFSDDFVRQMENCFSPSSELAAHLEPVLGGSTAPEAVGSYLDAYAGALGLDSYRSWAVLSPDGDVLNASETFLQSERVSVGDTVRLTDNILSVMRGGNGNGQRFGTDEMDFCTALGEGEERLLVYIRDTKEETRNLNWMLFSIILQAMLFGLLFAILLSFFLAKTITAPIQSLTRGAQQMAAGEFSAEIDVHSQDEIGTLTDTFNHMKDVLKNTLDQVSGERKKLETVFLYLKDAVLAFRADGSVMHLNTTARDLFSDVAGGAEQLTFPSMLVLCGIASSPEFRAALAENLKNDEEGHVIREIAMKERVFDLSVGKFRYMEENEEHSGIIAVFHDVTGRYELDRSRREFVANVSHELRTPLTSIKGAAETLLRYPDMPAEMRESFLSMAVEESDRMTRIVGDLLVLSRLDNNRTKWEITTFRLDTFLRHLCDVIRADAEAHRHRLYLRMEEGLPQITADRDRIEQVLLNIVSNAVKYTPDGGKILIRAMANDEFAAIAVRDNGMGIPEEDQPHLFERFYRVEKSRTTGAGGTGLGLAIAKELVEAHGGSIRLESRIGHGTEVTVLLPLKTTLKTEEQQDAPKETEYTDKDIRNEETVGEERT